MIPSTTTTTEGRPSSASRSACARAPSAGMPLSTTTEDSAPFLTNDGLTLYYASGPSGARDLYIATRGSVGTQFTSGTKIAELSTAFNDSDPWVSSDGREIYFISDRDGALRIWHASR